MGTWHLMTYPIPEHSWRGAQQPAVIRSRMGPLVVEECASSSATCRKTPLRRVRRFMDFDATETYLIPPRSRHPAQQPPAIRSRIGQLVVKASAIELWEFKYPIQYCQLRNKCRRGSTIYDCEACVMANSIPQRALESVILLLSHPRSSKVRPA